MHDDTFEPVPFVIDGAAGPHEAAAIAAAIHQALADELVRRSAPRRRPHVPAWVTVIRSEHPGRPERR